MHKICYINSHKAKFSPKEEYIIIRHKQGHRRIKKTVEHPLKKNLPRVVTLAAIILILVGASSFTAHRGGFLPLKIFLDTEEPIGDASEIDVDKYMKEYPQLNDLPNLNKIKHKLYGTDASINTVAVDYKQRLRNKGYKLKYTGTKTIRGISLDYFGFTKGLTVVGIVMTSDGISQFKNYDTVVLYTTGNLFAYKDAISWYNA